MPFRPELKPGPGDREVFIDPLPADYGSDELQEFLAAFGEVEEVAWWGSWRAERRDDFRGVSRVSSGWG